MRRTITSGVRGSHARGVSVFVMVVVLGSLVGAVSPAAADATCSNLPINGVWLGSWQGTAGTQALGGVVKNEYTFTGADVTSQIDLISGETALGPGAPTTVSWDSADATSCTYSFSGAVTGSGTFNATGPNAGLITGTWNYQSLASGTWLLGPATVSATGTGTAVTDNGNPPSAGTPIETAVTSPSGGTITIDESQTPGGSFPGYSLLNSFVRIDAPTTNTAGMPLLLTFDLDGSVTSGETAASVAVIRDGTAIPDCADTSGTASPDPCVSSRLSLGNGELQFSVLTSQASVWAFGVPTIGTGPGPAIHVANTSVREGNRGTKNARFVVTLSAKSGVPVTVAYATRNGTATAGSDYVATSGTLTFKPHRTRIVLKVPVVGDRVPESTETFQLDLTNPINAHFQNDISTATITDNDESRPARH